ncbi:WD40 repeat-like protein [Coemansia reversa NRRL 1564]|uniref:WD40 repeat-like protein n=1 Tax=Coemansia reversa (strain ATCC 12441 / NRRL 1564) TaxID=763665 RepID=A0A2G5BAW6_COERN|nr:WD40 repeat-like protein [Coemansia reversa NRRL 1564]|eukprot:PIA15857.1 WD40 repeat-like protein [Coemansia reversa NRRL 1564]
MQKFSAELNACWCTGAVAAVTIVAVDGVVVVCIGMFTEVVSIGSKSGIQVYDLRRGAKLAQCMGVSIGGRQGFGMNDMWVAAANETKAVCHVYALNRGDAGAKLVFPFPEEISCVQVFDGGNYFAAGSRSGRVLVWEIASGRMVGAWDAHYGAVTALASDEGVLVSGGEDAVVHVWLLSQALDQQALGSAGVAPIATMGEHTMPISAISIPQTGLLAGRARIYTASGDQTCKQWCVRVGRGEEGYVGEAQLLATFLYPAPVNDIAVDKSETRVFVGTADGLFQTNLYVCTRADADTVEDERVESELAALGGTSDAVFSKVHIEYPAAERHIVAVSLGHDGTLLVSASQEGTVRVWDTASRQCIRTISDKQLTTGVRQLYTCLAPPQLGGPRVLAGVGQQRHEAMARQIPGGKITSISFAPLQRLFRANSVAEAGGLEAGVKIRLSSADEDLARFDADLVSDTVYGETARGDMTLVGGLGTVDGTAKRQMADLQRQIEQLQRHSARTRRLNDELYQSAVTEWLGSRQKD